MSFKERPYPDTLRNLYSRALTSPNELSKAIRMWVILKTIYGENNDELKLILNSSFTYADWRDSFFGKTKIHQQEKAVDVHDSNCFCGKTIQDWLFEGDNAVHISKWQKTIERTVVKNWNLQIRPFACTRRSIQNSFKELVEHQWLNKEGDRYIKLEQLPEISADCDREHGVDTLRFISEDIADITGNYFEPINDISRFFIHVEYIPSNESLDRIEDYQNILKAIWSKTLVNPIQITYKSATFHNNKCLDYIVYPVCIYYYRRAPYLCAYGKTPHNSNTLQWYNYRLDNITELAELTWHDSIVPIELKNQCKDLHPEDSNYNPEYIKEQLGEAFGFDFYLDSETMLLRFEKEFSDRYIYNTERHPTFTHLSSIKEVEKFLNKSNCSPLEKTALIKKIKQYPDDTYYTMNYRQGDNNVIWRLRTWGAKVEVLYPISLRQTMINDIRAANKIYQ